MACGGDRGRLGGPYRRRLADVYRLQVPPGRRVLEIGCGSGDLLASLEPSVGVGVDFSEAMLARARRRHPGLGFDLAEYLEQLRVLAQSEFSLLAVALAALAYVALRPILRRHAPEESAPVGRCLLALATAITGQFLMVAKHSSPRYLLPAFGLMGAILALLLFDMLRTKGWAARLIRGVVLAGVCVLAWHGVQSFQAATMASPTTSQAFSEQLRDFFDAQPQRGVVVTYYGASSRAYALAFGNAWANNVCAASAAARHPPAYFYSVQGSGYSDLAGSVLTPEAVLRLPGPVYFHGRPFSRADGRGRPADFQFESVLTNGREALYKGVRPTALSK